MSCVECLTRCLNWKSMLQKIYIYKWIMGWIVMIWFIDVNGPCTSGNSEIKFFSRWIPRVSLTGRTSEGGFQNTAIKANAMINGSKSTNLGQPLPYQIVLGFTEVLQLTVAKTPHSVRNLQRSLAKLPPTGHRFSSSLPHLECYHGCFRPSKKALSDSAAIKQSTHVLQGL